VPLAGRGLIKGLQETVGVPPASVYIAGQANIFRVGWWSGSIASIQWQTTGNSSYDWHNDPIPQNVITLAVLEFTTVGEDIHDLSR